MTPQKPLVPLLSRGLSVLLFLIAYPSTLHSKDVERKDSPEEIIKKVAIRINGGQEHEEILNEYLLEFERRVFNSDGKEKFIARHRVMKKGEELRHDIKLEKFIKQVNRVKKKRNGAEPPMHSISIINRRGGWLILKDEKFSADRTEILEKIRDFTLEGLFPFILSFLSEFESLTNGINSCKSIEEITGAGKTLSIECPGKNSNPDVVVKIDKKTYLPHSLKLVSTLGRIEYLFSNYRKFKKGILLPQERVFLRNGRLTSRIRIEKFDTSPDLDDSTFDEERVAKGAISK